MIASILRTLGNLVLSLVVLTASTTALSAAKSDSKRPNLMVVLCDDLGYGDLACFGNPSLRTPNIDRFAEQGLKLTHCYAAAPNCSPARTGLMTGRTPYRVGVHNWIPFMSPVHVKESEITVATLLRDAGYQTCHVGKWHLNGMFNLPGQPQPGDHGFDHWFSTQNNCLPSHRNPWNFVRNGIPVGPLEGYGAHLVVDEALDWLRNKRDKSRPFFMFVCFHEPHEPIATDPKYEKLYPADDPSYSAHHGNITQMDDAFGRLIDHLDKTGLGEDTMVFFTSDNGPAITSIHPHGSKGSLREKKGHVYEGGIRVPGIVRWPGHTRPGSVSDEPVSGVDVLPTLCEIAGVPLPGDRALDGASFLPALKDRSIDRRTPLYWQFNWSPTEPKVAMRSGDWKILATLNTPQPVRGADILAKEQQAIKEAKLAEFQLYDLRTDPTESRDLADTETERLREMASTLRSLHSEVQNESPVWPAWEWPRYESQRIEWPAYRGQKRKRR